MEVIRTYALDIPVFENCPISVGREEKLASTEKYGEVLVAEEGYPVSKNC